VLHPFIEGGNTIPEYPTAAARPMTREQMRLAKEQLALAPDPTLQKIHRGRIRPADGESLQHNRSAMQQYELEVV
jgi:hypothetical protein